MSEILAEAAEEPSPASMRPTIFLAAEVDFANMRPAPTSTQHLSTYAHDEAAHRTRDQDAL